MLSHPEKDGVWDIHFVNYNRQEPDEKTKTGFIADENPISVSGVKADLVTPAGFTIGKVEWMTPESPDAQELLVERAGNRVRFTAPKFLVYGLARVHLVMGETTARTSVLPCPPSTLARLRPLVPAPAQGNPETAVTPAGNGCGTCHERQMRWETEDRAKLLARQATGR